MSFDPFLAHLADLCRDERTRAKWVVVPSHAVGLTLGDRLVRGGCEWVNLRFVTPLDLAIRMAAPFLVERGTDPSEEALGPALVMRLLLGLPETSGYFRPMAGHTSMAAALWRAIRELRYAGIRASDLASRPFTGVPEKQAEVVALLTAYERHLEAGHVADLPAVFEEAARHPDWSPVAADDWVLELPGTIWRPVVRRFLDVLQGRKVTPRTLRIDGLARPSRLASLASPEDPVAALPATDAARLRFLLAPGEAGPTRHDATLAIFHAGGRDAELDEVFRRIVSSGLPLDQVEVACSRAVPASLVWEKARRLAWDVTLSAGLPATATRPGRLLLRFCDWIASDVESAVLRRLLQSGDLAAKAIHADVSAGQASRLLLKAQATWGRETYGRSLTRLEEEYARRAADPEAADPDREWNARKAGQARALRLWVKAVLERAPVADDDGTVALSALVDVARWFVDEFAGQAGEMDALGRGVVVNALDELHALGTFRCDVSSGLRLLRERVESAGVGRERPRPGHLHVSSLTDAGRDARPVVFVVGLEEGAVFSSAVEDAVLLDVERRAIGHLLPTSADRLDEEVAAVASRLGALGASCRTICLSFSCRDTREFRETFPSWVVLQAFRLQQGNAALTYRDLSTYLGEPASSVPAPGEDAATDAAWWLAHRDAAGAEAAILHAFPSLERGRVAERERASDQFTAYDGLVPQAGAALDPSRSPRPVSATTLEAAAKCPLRFFMRYGLGVRPIEEGKADGDAWLAPMTKGSERHALYARIMRVIRAERRMPSLETDGPLLRRWGVERLDELKTEMPPPSEEVFARESREFLEDLDAFMRAECEGRHGAGIGFEVSFGFPVAPGTEEPLARPSPLVIDIGDGRRLVLHGWIDRINKIGPSRYEVADYKGSYWQEDWDGEFAGGTRLQHAIYGAAAVPALRTDDPKARVVRGAYLFPTVKGRWMKKVIEAPSTSKLEEVLRAVADVIGSGVFAPADGKNACTWCEFRPACHTDTGVTAAKVGDEDNELLAPYRALRSHV
jgi:ATP-dependent helicase/nuclease subunit B